MNKNIVSVLIAGGMMVAISFPSYAVDRGTVNFTGKIVSDTCEINVDGSGSGSETVTFLSTNPGQYNGDGTVGTSKDFSIALNKCDPAVTDLNLIFTGTTSDAAKKRLENNLSGAGSATNVGITITNKNGSNSDVLFDGSVPDAATDVANDSVNGAVFNYTANVIQIGSTIPTTGQYAASASFEVFYR